MAEINFHQDPFQSRRWTHFYREKLATTPSDHTYQRLEYQNRLATHLLQAGQSEQALDVINAALTASQTAGLRLDARSYNSLTLLHALAYLRVAEQENCLNHHSPESCIVPITADGTHQLQRGSLGAISILTQYLKNSPADLQARWLLNLAAMTVGDYPHKVPKSLLIPEEVFASDFHLERFPDISTTVGVDVDGLAGGCIAEDFDRDGNLDLLISDWSLQGQLRLILSDGRGHFLDRTVEAGLRGLVGGLNMMQTDFDNDGLPDVFILRGGWLGIAGHHPNSLLRNQGDGTFDDVTEQAGLLSFHPTQTATWFDFDNDGWLDLFIGNESTDMDRHPCELYRNNRDGTFTECAALAGLDVVAFVKGATSGDYNNDGRPDLYLSTRNGTNRLFRNDGPKEVAGTSVVQWTFTDITRIAGVGQPFHSFPTWFWDYDNDGWLDIMVLGYSIRSIGDVVADVLGLPHTAERPRLYRNQGDGTFADATERTKLNRVLLAMGSNYGDLDNDGWLDFYLGTGDTELATLVPNRMFRNHGGHTFQDVTTSGGFGHIQKGHGIAFADFNNDGAQDIFIKIGGAYPGDNYRSALFANPGNTNYWITLELEGVQSNRAAMGARIRVIIRTPDGQRTIHRTVGSGASFGASPLRQSIGLGGASQIDRIEIDWPATGQTQLVRGVTCNRFYRIREGESTAIPWDLKRFPWPVGTPDPHHFHHGAHPNM